MESLSHKVIQSGLWSLGGNWLIRGLGIIKMIILARFLSPVDFGILGLAMLSINALNVFSETGVESALIQRVKIGRSELNTAWTMAIIKGVLLFVVLFLSAGWIAAYFDNFALEPVLKVMAVTFLIGGCTNIGIVFFQKDLEFKKKAILESIADIAGTVIAILLAFWLRNVWALVIGSLVWVTVKCVGSYRLSSYRPQLQWNWHTALGLLNFGKHIFWINLIAFIITNVDDALVGKLLDLNMLGFYVMAYSISSIPVTSLSAELSRIFFPAYAKIQNDPQRIAKAFGQTFETVLLVLLPLTSLMITLAPNFTTVFLGEKWLFMVPALQVLCFFGLFRCVSGLFYPLHLAMNRPDIQTKIKSLDLVTFIILIYPLTLNWGILGTSCAMAIVYLINLISNIAFTSKLILIRWKKIAISLLVPIMISLLFFLIYFLMRSVQIPLGEVTEFITALILCLCIGLITAVTFRKKLLLNFIDHLKAAQK
jgi:O-antigen/teichoic acid export membrane protein